MAVKLNKEAFNHAQKLINDGKLAWDEKDHWSDDQPTEEKENSFITEFGWEEYSKWYLGLDDEHKEETKSHYKFPYGDFELVHRCGVISAETRAGQYKYQDIEKAAHVLHEMLDRLKEE